MATSHSGRKTSPSQSSGSSCRTIIIKTIFMYLTITSLLCAGTFAQDLYEDKKNDPNNRPFYMGSRYGRSGQPSKVQVVPRNDRFFMGSRYGKRTNLLSTAENGEEINPNEVPLDDIPKTPNQGRLEALLAGNEFPKTSLSCAYLGIGNLYRCSHRDFSTGPSR